jgi:hypothetical protein
MAHLFCIEVPAGLEKFIEEAGRLISYGEFQVNPTMDEANIENLQQTAIRYGQEVYPPDYLD